MKHLNKISMKRMSIYRILAVLVTATILFSACTKENAEVRLESRLATSQLLNVTSNSATVVGFVKAEGPGFSEKGVCYNTATAPTIANNKVAYTGQATTATYNVTLTGLAYATKYYARAYATIKESGTIYGEEYSFTTLPVVPVLTTAAITVITGNSAKGGGNVTATGGAEVTVRGVVFGTNPAPTIADSKTTDDKGPGAFVSTLASLKGNTTYYVRAYATNSAGTGYGPEVNFKTLVDLPVVTTAAVTAVTKVSAVTGGEVTYDGGAAVTEKGLVWSKNANPTITDTKITGGAGIGAFVSNLAGLTLNSTYHVRAYATNSAGTAYGANIQFTTQADITKLWVVGDYNGWDNSNNAKFIISTATSNGDAEGYVYLKSGGFKLATDHSWSDAATFGDNGAGKLTNPGGNIAVPADGYYLIKANISTMTYSITLTTWGIIGDATAGSWDNQTNMVFDPLTQKFSVVARLTAGGAFKFRGTSNWSVNYGSVSADGKLDTKDNNNIPVTTTADYAITLDLSQPNAYAYSLTSWGLIGDATPGGWDTDTQMSWDAAKKVWTVTVALVSGNGGKTFKFRANKGWDVNFGGKGSGDGTADNYSNATTAPLNAGGKNLGVPGNVDGTYTVTLDTVNLIATVTKN
jgi:starch-binding outer membrane protein SusE/F